ASGQAAFPVLSALLIALLLPRKKFAGFPLAITVLLLTGFELFFYGMGLNASTEDPRTAYREQPQLVEMLKADQAKELSRARIRSAHAILLKRNQGPYDRIQLLEGYNPLVLQRNAPQCVNSEITADLLNIKWSVVENGQQAGFGQRPTYLPRVKMYYKTIVKPDEDAVAILKSDSSFDYRNTILLEENPSIQISAVDSSATATVISFETDHITGKVHTAANGMLFFSEVYYPAWHAYIDGKETKLYRAFTALRAVEVPIGDHTVELRYESSAFRTGSYITLATLIASVLALVIVSRKKSGGETN
ncbi:MAG TPA: YfhO family protein, partial [Steroidobacteraceae bacterium]|nr:YfhO family protein [Steroidobacteraceae bacterium]